jgi:hypothetical protein
MFSAVFLGKNLLDKGYFLTDKLSRLSQNQKEKYGHGSREAWTQKWLCWRRPAGLYPKPRNHKI